ncbi:MAG: DUF1810 domain-containing protein [Pseudomonadota bacterium]
MTDLHNLSRFLTAQAGTYPTALAELCAGAKRTHWMWFIFPQLAELGHSPTAQHYAIRSLAEAQAYLAHPILGARLRECVAALQALPAERTAEQVFGAVDAAKLRSSLTLFTAAGAADLAPALGRWSGSPDPRTLTLLGE